MKLLRIAHWMLLISLFSTLCVAQGQGTGGGPTGGGAVTAPAMQTAISTQTGCTTLGYVWVPASNTCVANGAGSSAFSALTSSTNSTASMVVGTGASLGISGTGTITSTLHEFPATASTGGTTANLLVVYDGATGNVTTSPTASAGTVGIASATATSGNPLFVIDSGITTCIADNTVTVGNLLGVGTTTAGRCKDLGTAQGNGVPSNTQIVGKAVTGGSAAASITVQTVGAGHYGTLVVAASVNTSICSNNGCSQNTTGTAAGLAAQYVDYNASSGGASIKNKPALNSAATDSNVTSDGSGNVTATTFTATGSPALTGTEGSAPSAPASGKDVLYVENTNGIASINSSSVKKYMVAPAASRTANQFVTNITAAGAQTTAAIAAADLPAALANSTSVNGTTIPSGGVTLTRTIASGTIALATSSISTASCQTITQGSVNSAAATGTLTTDAISFAPNGSIKAITGYVPATTGGLTIVAYPTAGYVNFDVCNWTSGAITPGALTLNWRVVR